MLCGSATLWIWWCQQAGIIFGLAWSRKVRDPPFSQTVTHTSHTGDQAAASTPCHQERREPCDQEDALQPPGSDILAQGHQLRSDSTDLTPSTLLPVFSWQVKEKVGQLTSFAPLVQSEHDWDLQRAATVAAPFTRSAVFDDDVAQQQSLNQRTGLARGVGSDGTVPRTAPHHCLQKAAVCNTIVLFLSASSKLWRGASS